MRNESMIESIAQRRQLEEAWRLAIGEMRQNMLRHEMNHARTGPPRPVGSRIHPKPQGCDWGLVNLRDRCYAKLRKARQQ